MCDNNGAHQCLVCGKRITWRFAICSNCERIYGHTVAEWPAWLTFMWQDCSRQRRRAKAIAAHEVTLSDLPNTLFNDTAEETIFYE